MSLELTEQSFIIIKAYIDAKDDRGQDINGAFFAVASMRDTRFAGVVFTRDKTIEKKNKEELFKLLENKDSLGDSRDFLSIQCEDELLKYFEMSRLLNSIAKNRNLKHAEQIISRFFMDKLRLKAVTFIEFSIPSPLELDVFGKKTTKPSQPIENINKPTAEPAEISQPAPKKDPRDLMLRCEPVYDPVSGIAPTELESGAIIICKLPEDSIFYKLLKKNVQNFDGTVEGVVTKITINSELGSATLDLTFSDGVYGTIKLSNKARVKIANSSAKPIKDMVNTKKQRSKAQQLSFFPDDAVFLIAALILIAAAIAVMIYILNDF